MAKDQVSLYIKELGTKSQMAFTEHTKPEMYVNKEKYCVINFLLELCHNLVFQN